MHGVRHATPAAHSELRAAIVTTLRREGPLGPTELGRRLAASRSSVLQQLRELERDGYAARATVRHGVGRPRHVYDLTAEAQSLFPDAYPALAADLIAALERTGGRDAVADAFAQRRARLRDVILARFEERGVAGAALERRVEELARYQDEQGYLCECRAESGGVAGCAAGAEGEPLVVEGTGTIRLREHNCAIFEVARRDPTPCREEALLFAEVLGARVVRETHIASGDRSCTYRIEPTATA